jgi:P-type conjugative transfer protein TrbG
MFDRKSVEQIFKWRNLSWLATSSLLASCATSPNMEAATPSPVYQSASMETHMPSKSEFLQTQGADVTKAYYEYEKTGKAIEIKSNQSIKVPFGKGVPVVECAPLHTCDIKLEAGEKITGVYPGDSTRWLFEEASSGEGSQQQMHVIFKPKDYDISTNAIITTSKRTYHFDLHSQKDAVEKTLEFYYPEDIKEEWKTLQHAEILARQEQVLSEKPSWDKKSLDYHYRIETPLFDEKPIWTPVSVFNDGSHVYIQMPAEATTASLPTLFIIGKDAQPKLVNYRVKSPYFIVDELFSHAEFESGVGQYQQRVTITYKK